MFLTLPKEMFLAALNFMRGSLFVSIKTKRCSEIYQQSEAQLFLDVLNFQKF